MSSFTLRRAKKPAPPLPEPVFDRRGYYRSPITLSSYRKGQPAANKGRKFPIEVLTQLSITQAYLHKLNPAAELELIRNLDWGHGVTGAAGAD